MNKQKKKNFKNTTSKNQTNPKTKKNFENVTLCSFYFDGFIN